MNSEELNDWFDGGCKEPSTQDTYDQIETVMKGIPATFGTIEPEYFLMTLRILKDHKDEILPLLDLPGFSDALSELKMSYL